MPRPIYERNQGSAESWVFLMIFMGDVSGEREDIIDRYNLHRHYDGPGLSFSSATGVEVVTRAEMIARVEENGGAEPTVAGDVFTLFMQSGGLDI